MQTIIVCDISRSFVAEYPSNQRLKILRFPNHCPEKHPAPTSTDCCSILLGHRVMVSIDELELLGWEVVVEIQALMPVKILEVAVEETMSRVAGSKFEEEKWWKTIRMIGNGRVICDDRIAEGSVGA
jgi:hypothetical protein